MAEHRGNASGHLSSDDGALPGTPAPMSVAAVGKENVGGRFQAVINCHGCNLHQIEVAIATNMHEVDPHPALPGKYVSRHPIILAAWDHSASDDQGRPLEGKPAELNMTLIREVFHTRYPDQVSVDPPPVDGSHIDVEGMHVIAETDSSGNPTGRVRLGSPDEVEP